MSPVLYCTDIADSTSGCRQFSVLEYFRVSSSIKVPAEFVNNKKQRGSSDVRPLLGANFLSVLFTAGMTKLDKFLSPMFTQLVSQFQENTIYNLDWRNDVLSLFISLGVGKTE